MNLENKIKIAIEKAHITYDYGTTGIDHTEDNVNVYAFMNNDEVQEVIIAYRGEVVELLPKYIYQIHKKLYKSHQKSIKNDESSKYCNAD